jgi:hypothetical protein
LVVLALIPYHTAAYFVTGDWAPWRYAPSPVVTVLVAFAVLVAMPLMFFIAGMGVHFSLRKRTAGAFVGERFLRLFVPLAVGHLLLLPPIQYFALRRSPLFAESFAQFYRSFFDVTLKLGFPPLLTGPRYMAHHLGFLKDLLVYTLVLLPVFVYATGSGRAWSSDWRPFARDRAPSSSSPCPWPPSRQSWAPRVAGTASPTQSFSSTVTWS